MPHSVRVSAGRVNKRLYNNWRFHDWENGFGEIHSKLTGEGDITSYKSQEGAGKTSSAIMREVGYEGGGGRTHLLQLQPDSPLRLIFIRLVGIHICRIDAINL